MKKLEYNNNSTQAGDSEEKGDTEPAIKPYDVVIIGSGPAGYTAGIYASMVKLRTLIQHQSPFSSSLLLVQL